MGPRPVEIFYYFSAGSTSQQLRRWPYIKPTLFQCVVLAGFTRLSVPALKGLKVVPHSVNNSVTRTCKHGKYFETSELAGQSTAGLESL